MRTRTELLLGADTDYTRLLGANTANCFLVQTPTTLRERDTYAITYTAFGADTITPHMLLFGADTITPHMLLFGADTNAPCMQVTSRPIYLLPHHQWYFVVF